MSRLYELTTKRLELQNKLEALNLDEVTIADTLEGDSTELAEKIEDCGWVIKNMDSFIGAIKAEEVRLADRRKNHEKIMAGIKEYLLSNMVACNMLKIECPVFSVTIVNNPGSVVIDNDKLLPDEYWTVPELPIPNPNKRMIGTDIRSGKEVPGAHMEQSQRVEIK